MLECILPATPSAFQRARCRVLHRYVLQPRAAIFGHKQNNGLQKSPPASCIYGKGGDVRRKPANQVCKSWSGRCSRISEISPSGEVEIWVGTSRLTGVGFAAQILSPAAISFLDFPAPVLGAALLVD
jgi:hypothetical protein